jgi:type II secretory pathway component PulK
MSHGPVPRSPAPGLKPQASSLKPEKGAALVIVLLLLAIITIILAEFLYEQRINSTLLRNHEAKVRARYIARAGQNAAKGMIGAARPDDETFFNNDLIQLFKYECVSSPSLGSLDFSGEEEEPTIRPREAGPDSSEDEEESGFEGMEGCGLWSLYIPYVLDETPLDIEIFDEQARLNLNALLKPKAGSSPSHGVDPDYELNKDMLWVLLELFKYQAFKHEIEISDLDLRYMLEVHLYDYISHGMFDSGGTSYFEYEDDDAIVPMKNAWLDTVDEIRYLPGMTDELFDATKDFLTVYPVTKKGQFNQGQFNQKVHLNTAPLEVVYALIMGTSYNNDDPTITPEEAMELAVKTVNPIYKGSQLPAGSGAVASSIIQFQRPPPILPFPKNVFDSMTYYQNNGNINAGSIPRFWRIKATALTEDGLETTITRVIKYISPNFSVLYYRED